MKAVCIAGSPRTAGNIANIVAEIIRALEEQKVHTTVHHLHRHCINYCLGCKVCNATGKCVQSDDVPIIAEDILTADLVILASPSYWGDVTGQMKVFIDRCAPYCNTNPARHPFHPRPRELPSP